VTFPSHTFNLSLWRWLFAFQLLRPSTPVAFTRHSLQRPQRPPRLTLKFAILATGTLNIGEY
jgi:hypothetical protein